MTNGTPDLAEIEAATVRFEPETEMKVNGIHKPVPKFIRTTTTTIMSTVFEPIRWIVPDYLPEGFSVLAGRQKLGKSFLAVDWAIAVACGGSAMGEISVEWGDVLYVDLENGERRVQRRIQTLYPDERVRPDLSRLEWVTDAPSLGNGFIPALDNWRQSVTKPRLVVIDVLQRVKPAGIATRNSYENDYSIWAPLQRWAMQHGIAVLGLHHTRKGGADDPLESLSGSNGLSACADTTLVLDRDSNGITLYVRGRDVDEKQSALTFAAGAWTLVGDAAAIRRTDERSTILNALAEADEPMSPREIADVTEMSSQNIRQMLVRMVRSGDVIKESRGRYSHPSHPRSQRSQSHKGERTH